MIARVLSAAAILAAFAFAVPASAQGNPQSSPSGGRSALMGNTGTALAVDGAAPVMNPATILRIPDARLALSVNFYGYEHTSLRGFHAPSPVDARRYGDLSGDSSIGRHRFTSLPSTFCVFLTVVADRLADRASVPRPRHKLALCVGSTERSSFEAIGLGFAQGASSQTRSLVRSFGRTYAGPSYAVALGDRVALGASVALTQTSATWLTFGSTTTNGPLGVVASSYERASDLSSWDFGGSLGATYKLDAATTLGARVTFPLGHLTGGLDAAESATSNASSSEQRSLTGVASAPTVPALALGIGREVGAVRVEANATLHLPLGGLLSAELSGEARDASGASRRLAAAIEERGRPTLNAGAGVEVRTSPSLSVLGGLATDFSMSAPLRSSPNLGELGYARRQRALVSAGIASREGANELLIGTQLGIGWGQSAVLDGYQLPNQLRVVEERSTSVLLVVAGNASLSGIRRSIDRIRGR